MHSEGGHVFLGKAAWCAVPGRPADLKSPVWRTGAWPSTSNRIIAAPARGEHDVLYAQIRNHFPPKLGLRMIQAGQKLIGHCTCEAWCCTWAVVGVQECHCHTFDKQGPPQLYYLEALQRHLQQDLILMGH